MPQARILKERLFSREPLEKRGDLFGDCRSFEDEIVGAVCSVVKVKRCHKTKVDVSSGNAKGGNKIGDPFSAKFAIGKNDVRRERLEVRSGLAHARADDAFMALVNDYLFNDASEKGRRQKNECFQFFHMRKCVNF